MNVLTRRERWGFAVPAVLAAAVLPLALTAEPEGPAPPAGAAPAAGGTPPLWAGSGKCSGRGCHGAVAPEGTKGSEYNTWKVLDRHARAYAVLLNDRSKRIEANLRGPEGPHPERDQLCLACHNQPGTPPGGPPLLTVTGIGCEACHGSAVGWLAEHSRPEWKQVPPETKRDKGMILLDTAASRAAACMRCHVGNADQEVHHDLIAAGHPRLNFEMGAFLADMPEHWNAAAVTRKHGPISEAETWAAGQVLAARAAADLLVARTAQARAPRWPEFTEYGCFACHHALRDQGLMHWREELGLRPGALPWGTWTFALVGDLAAQAGTAGLPSDLDDLARRMGAPYPDRQAVKQRATGIVQTLDACLAQLQAQPYRPQQLRELLDAIHRDPQRFQQRTAHWDAAAQFYLALNALHQDLGSNPERQAALDALRALLEFPPTELDGTFYDSPGGKFDAEQVRAAIGQFFEALPEP